MGRSKAKKERDKEAKWQQQREGRCSASTQGRGTAGSPSIKANRKGADTVANMEQASAQTEGQSITVALCKRSQEARAGMLLVSTEAGTTVDALNESGLAAAAGIQMGDTVVCVNGVAITNHEHGAALILAAHGTIEVILRRKFNADTAALGTCEAFQAPEKQLSGRLSEQHSERPSPCSAPFCIDAPQTDAVQTNIAQCRSRMSPQCTLQESEAAVEDNDRDLRWRLREKEEGRQRREGPPEPSPGDVRGGHGVHEHQLNSPGTMSGSARHVCATRLCDPNGGRCIHHITSRREVAALPSCQRAASTGGSACASPPPPPSQGEAAVREKDRDHRLREKEERRKREVVAPPPSGQRAAIIDGTACASPPPTTTPPHDGEKVLDEQDYKKRRLGQVTQEVICGPSREEFNAAHVETDADWSLMSRQRSIEKGKNTLQYITYTSAVPRSRRQLGDPLTPKPADEMSRRNFDGKVKEWRRALDQWSNAHSEAAVREKNRDRRLRQTEEQREPEATSSAPGVPRSDWVQTPADSDGDIDVRLYPSSPMPIAMLHTAASPRPPFPHLTPPQPQPNPTPSDPTPPHHSLPPTFAAHLSRVVGSTLL
jgi:hypothetical protein